jgi:hypothetical protein
MPLLPHPLTNVQRGHSCFEARIDLDPRGGDRELVNPAKRLAPSLLNDAQQPDVAGTNCSVLERDDRVDVGADGVEGISIGSRLGEQNGGTSE